MQGLWNTPRRKITREQMVEALKSVPWAQIGVEWVVLFGSVAKAGAGRDVDLLVYFSPARQGDPYRILEASLRISEHLGLDPDSVDVVDARKAPCLIVRDAWRHGIVVYESSHGSARGWLLERAVVCHDYEIMRRKLDVDRVSAWSMIKRWST